MRFNNNALVGTIPSTLGSLYSLTSFDVGMNQISGTLPPELVSLHSATSLGFESNRFSGTLPSSWGEHDAFSALERISLSDNFLTGVVPNMLSGNNSRAISSFELYLDHNMFVGSIPFTVPQLWQVECHENYLFYENNVNCLPHSSYVACGDGILAALETCDDGNNIDGDGCDSDCSVSQGYACSIDADTYHSVCVEVCGDGIRTGIEECDNGVNGVLQLGCVDCSVPDDYACTGDLGQGSNCTRLPSPVITSFVVSRRIVLGRRWIPGYPSRYKLGEIAEDSGLNVSLAGVWCNCVTFVSSTEVVCSAAPLRV